jgi:hypothetical protein
MMIWFHLSKYACGICIAGHTKDPGMGFTFEEFVDEIEDFNNVLDAFEKRDADKADGFVKSRIFPFSGFPPARE